MTIDVRAMVAVSVRRTPVRAIAGAGLVGGVGVIARAMTADDAEQLLPFVRLSAIVVAAAATLAVDDPSAPLADTTWRGRRARAPFFLIPAGLIAALVWAATAVTTRWLVDGSTLPIGGLLGELVGLMIVGWLITAAFAESRGPHGAPLAGAITLMALAIGTMSVPRTMGWLWRSPGPDWGVSHIRWGLVAGGSAFLLRSIWRDPAR